MISRALHLDIFDQPGRKLLFQYAASGTIYPSLGWEGIKGRVMSKDIAVYQHFLQKNCLINQ